MSTIAVRLRLKKRDPIAPANQIIGVDKPAVFFPIRYRIIFYVGGILFAALSYIAGVWAFGSDSTSLGPATFTTFPLRQANAHALLFIMWSVVCIGVSVITGMLFEHQYAARVMAERQANTDGLTGLYNHAYFQKRLDEEINRAMRHGRSLSLIMLDLDNFKSFNDTWGHQEGDLLLKWFSEILHSSIRDHDLVSRYGGEEFVILLPETDILNAMSVAQRIVETTQRLSPAAIGKEREVTASAGVSTFPTHGTTKYMLIMSADTALYRAKLKGKNRAIEYTMDDDLTSTAQSINKLNDNKGNSEVLTYLATIVDGRNNYNKYHSDSVEGYSLLLGKAFGLSVEELQNLRTAAILHDLGKICIPEAILAKTDPLTQSDWSAIREHVQVGAAMLSRAGQNESIIPSVLHHHEHYDGSGYPDALAGRNIPLFARIIAIADAYKSMTSSRPYRKTMTNRRALNEIRRCSGTQFDSELSITFIDAMKALRRRKAA